MTTAPATESVTAGEPISPPPGDQVAIQPTAPTDSSSTVTDSDNPTEDTGSADTNPSRATPEAIDSPNATARTALAAWRMGSEWSMAAALQAKGQQAADFADRLDIAADEAFLLGVDLPALPEHDGSVDVLAENLNYLLAEVGPRIAAALTERYGADHAALAELATKTHVLLLSYTPSSTQLDPVIESIRRAAKESGLAEDLWRELVDLLVERADFKRVKAAVFQLHREVPKVLAAGE